MPEYCTCGAELPPDARFCHKCGKPQREEPHLLEEEPEPEIKPEIVPEPKAAVPPAINFHNLAAVRVAFLSAALASVLSSLPMPFIMLFVWLIASGFFSVHLYQRRTGYSLSPRNGARIGWITGVFSFVISTVLFTVSMLGLAGHTDEFVKLLREQLSQRGFPSEMIDQAIAVLMSPMGFTLAILISLVLRFVSFAAITALGGALAARVLGKGEPGPRAAG